MRYAALLLLIVFLLVLLAVFGCAIATGENSSSIVHMKRTINDGVDFNAGIDVPKPVASPASAPASAPKK